MNLIGQILQNRYRVIHQIGEGGMGRVYYGEDIRLNQEVAIKETMNLDSDESSETIAARIKTFKREAELLAGKIKHPAIPKVIDYFQFEKNWYIIMEYIDGNSLEEQRKQINKPFSAEEVLLWIDQLLQILDSLHHQFPPIIHRDIKPSNIKVKNGKVYLLDFGLAKELAGLKSTVASFITPAFASLEQITNKDVTERSDLYSVAATMYCLLTNEVPTNASERSLEILGGKPDPIKQGLNHHKINRGIADIILDALSLHPEGRPASAESMRLALKKADLTETVVDAPEKTLPAHPFLIKETTTKILDNPPNKRKIFWKPLLIGLILLILILSGVWAFRLRNQDFFGNSQAVSEPTPTPKTPRQIASEKTEQAIEMLYVNDYEKAKFLSKEAIDADSTYALAHAIYGDAFWDEDPTEEEDSSTNTKSQISKGEIFKIFDGNEPVAAEDLAARAWAFLANKKWDRAKQDIEKVIMQKPEWGWALMQKAFVVIGRGGGGCVNEKGAKEILDAISTYKKINSLKPRYAIAYINLAGAYICNEQNQEAFNAYEQAISLWQKPDFYVRRGNFYLNKIEAKTKQKNIENAQKDFEEALKKEPKSSDARVGLSKVYDYKEEYQSCINEADKALLIKLSYDAYIQRGTCRASLAAKEKDGKGFDEALDNLEKARELVDKYNDPTIRQNALANYYYQKANIQINYKATYLLTEKYLKNRTSVNKKAVTAELINAKSSAEQAVVTNQDKHRAKDYEKFKRQIEQSIRDFKKQFG